MLKTIFCGLVNITKKSVKLPVLRKRENQLGFKQLTYPHHFVSMFFFPPQTNYQQSAVRNCQLCCGSLFVLFNKNHIYTKMFNNLASYLLGMTAQEPTSSVDTRTDIRLTAVVSDDDWVLVDRALVDRDSEGDTDIYSSLDSIPEALEIHHPTLHHYHTPSLIAPTLLTRTSSTSSLPCASIEESWFLTPPPCFTSAGPVHMETSPLENLLIEHPSMSVYQHSSTSSTVVVRRHNSAPSSSASSLRDDNEEFEAVAVRLEVRAAPLVPQQQERRPSANMVKQQEKLKNAQKLQIQKACQQLKRGYIERNNKAREVNCRNHRQRRGERSQGSARSNANNNRKCC